MAPTFRHAECLTRLTTFSYPSLNKWVWWNRHLLQTSRRYKSNLKKPSSSSEARNNNEPRAALGLIESLLPAGRNQTTTQGASPPHPKETAADAVRAEFVTEVRKYSRTSPTENWRHRSILGTRYDASDESGRQGRHSLGWSQEIAFNKKLHRKLLEPPYL